MDEEISELKKEVTTLKSEEKALRSQLSALNTTVSLPNLRASVVALGQETQELREKLSALTSGAVRVVSAEERAEVEKSSKLWGYRAKARKKACLELWSMICENLPDGKQNLWVSTLKPQ